MKVDVTDKGVTKTIDGKKALARATISIAFNKENPPQVRLTAINMIQDRVDGKSNQKVEMSGEVQQTKKVSLLDIVDMDALTGNQKQVIEELIEKGIINE